jgi:CheY-like chemotaxis protein
MADAAPTTLAAVIGALLGGGGIAALVRALRRPTKGDAELRREVADLRDRVARLERLRDDRHVTGTRPAVVSVPAYEEIVPAVRDAGGILVVDDDVHYARAARKLLSSLGVPVDMAITVDEVCARVTEHVYDVAVVDLGLLGITADQIVAMLPRTTAVVLNSGRDIVEIEAVRKRIGAQAAIAKSDGGDTLMDAVRGLLPRKDS